MRGKCFLLSLIALASLGGCSPENAPPASVTSPVTTAAGATETTAAKTTANEKPSTETAAPTTTTAKPEGPRETIHGKEWIRTFFDDFDGDSLDMTKWSYCPNWTRDDCIWTDSQAVLDGTGNLKLRVSGASIPYAAGAIRTREKFEQTYGYFEVRCRLTPIAGINPSFWLMCDGAGQVGALGGSDGAEIDIIEAPYFKTGMVQHALHWDGYGEMHGTSHKEITRPELYQGYHTFGLEWNETEYIFYIDGEESWRTHSGGVCRVPVYMKLTLGVGAWTGKLDPAHLPVDGMIVDYVKAYTAA